MMEETDFDDEVLLIHPDEDIRKIDAIETDIYSNLELASDSEIKKIEAIEIDNNSVLEQTFDSDSGEIDDDEEANDLEEGEIKDSSPVSKKKSDIACRFFRRGSCAYGSQCQYLHVSDSVYKMFDTNPHKRNDIPLVEHPTFPKPLIFPPIILPQRPFIEPPISVAQKSDFHRQCDTFEDTWEKGLEQAKILIQKANLKKKNEECEQKKINSKNTRDEKIKGQYFTKTDLGNEIDFNNKKYYEKNPTNSGFRKENTYDEKKSNYRYQPRSNDKWVDPWRRSKSPLSRKRPRSLSGSLPSRSRKHSSTSSISSVSSSSEFDIIYGRPYKKSPRDRQGFKSRSRSISQSRRPKKQKISPRHSSNERRNLRTNSRSLSGSPYRKRTVSSHSESKSSISSSSYSDFQRSPVAEDKEMRKISAKLDEQISQKSPKRISELLDSDCETSEMTVSSASCTSISSDSEADSPHHASFLKSERSPNQNNASFYSNKTASLSKQKIFNRNQSTLFKNQDSVHRKSYTEPAYQKKMQPSDNHKNLNHWSFKTKPTDCKPKNTASYFSSVKKSASVPKCSENKMSSNMEMLSAYQKKMQPFDNSKSISKRNFKTEPTDSKPKNSASFFNSVKKPASAPKVSENKLSGDMELLLMYQNIGNSNKNSSSMQKEKSIDHTSKPIRAKDAVTVTDKDNSNSQSHDRIPRIGDTPNKNIVLNLQPKCKDYFKPDFEKSQDFDEMPTVKKETASKREQLLNKLKLIDDAIARKKGK